MEASHACPDCGGRHAERRTPRNVLERTAVVAAHYHPYRCLDCGRRFLDRPRRRGAERRGADLAIAHAPVLDITSPGAGTTKPRRRPRWIIDAGNAPLGPSEIYALVVAVALATLIILAVLRFLWPEAGGGVKLSD